MSGMTSAAKDASSLLKKTLRLPKTTFPPRPHPRDIEKYLSQCTDDLYAWQRDNRPASNTFKLHDGPPYANGDLHVGHALNKILKDITCRTKLAEGKRIEYVPGWDCHGLPIELKALQSLKKGTDLTPVKIRQEAQDFAARTVSKQLKGFKSWGVMADWANHWTTMQKDFEIRQLQVFAAMADHSLIQRKYRPVYWSPSSGTALAEAELEYKDDHASTAAYVRFPLQSFSGYEDVSALVWTTTPWTIPSNQAIAISRDLTYSIVESVQHGKLLVARSRVAHLQGVLKDALITLEEGLNGRDLVGCKYDGLTQFGPQAVNRRIVHADFVSADSGTGLVHCAPGHGMEDYFALRQLIEDHQVTIRAPVDDAGRFTADACPDEPDLLQGQNVFTDGSQSVLRMLANEDRLVHKHRFVHKYPIDWRTKEPVVIRATAQWFADVSSIRNDALQSLEDVRFMPETGKARLKSFIENRSEWCISRQRSWGVPLPIVYHRDTGEAITSSASIRHIIDTIRARGTNAWWSDPSDDPAWIYSSLEPSQYQRGTDTMDVWFDSGTSWTSMKQSNSGRSQLQADVYLEGSDQHRGWFQSSLLTSIAFQRSLEGSSKPYPPFTSLVTHGFTLDAEGKKMSKSLGNVISPQQIISGLEFSDTGGLPTSSKKNRQQHALGPDALRLWVASSDWTRDVIISNTVVKAVHHALDKYRIVIKLLLGLLKDFDPANALPYDELSMLDRIALLHLYEVRTTAFEAMEHFEFHKALNIINRWIAIDLSGFYIEAIKDIMYCEPVNSERRLSTCTTLHHVFLSLQQMLAPITPMLVQESYDHSTEIYKQIEPLKQVAGPPPEEWHNNKLERVLSAIAAVNRTVKVVQEQARTEKLLGQSLASEVVLVGSAESRSTIESIPLQTWKEMLVVSDVEVVDENDFDEIATSLGASEDQWIFRAVISNGPGEVWGRLLIKKPGREKCDRCWRYIAHKAEEGQLTLCDRCTDVVAHLNA